MDADVAEESAEMSKELIQQQAGTAILAQANLQPRMVLDLLRD
jgi:flagellin